MIFACIARYTEDADLIAATRPLHRAYAQSLRAAGRLLVAGPFADDSGAILVYEAGSADEVHALIAHDPYQQRGVFVGAEVKQWNVIAGGDVEARLTAAGRDKVNEDLISLRRYAMSLPVGDAVRLWAEPTGH